MSWHGFSAGGEPLESYDCADPDLAPWDSEVAYIVHLTRCPGCRTLHAQEDDWEQHCSSECRDETRLADQSLRDHEAYLRTYPY